MTVNELKIGTGIAHIRKTNVMQTWENVLQFANKGNLTPDRRIEKTDAEWRALLTPEQFRITRKKGTEPSFTGELCSRYDPGKYNCICCDTELFDSGIKFDSRTGWPSFTQPIKDNVISYEKDVSYGVTRIEVSCSTCDAHLGHVFPDGPRPGGLRYCINSESLRLVAEEKKSTT
jgi:peptide-methionine (R)-S-oxide reductase